MVAVAACHAPPAPMPQIGGAADAIDWLEAACLGGTVQRGSVLRGVLQRMGEDDDE